MSIIAVRKYKDKIIYASDSLRAIYNDNEYSIYPYEKEDSLNSKMFTFNIKDLTIITLFTGAVCVRQAFNYYLTTLLGEYNIKHLSGKQKEISVDRAVYSFVQHIISYVQKNKKEDATGSIILGLNENIYFIEIYKQGFQIDPISEFRSAGSCGREVVMHLMRKGYSPEKALKEILIDYPVYTKCKLPINVLHYGIKKQKIIYQNQIYLLTNK